MVFVAELIIIAVISPRLVISAVQTKLYNTIPRLYAITRVALHLLSMNTTTNHAASNLSDSQSHRYGQSNVTDTLPIILCVDDDAQQRMLLRAVLEHFGFHVMAAKSALDALEIAQWLPFDVALLDYELPDMTGAQLAQQIRAVEPNVAIILLSGYPHLRPGELTYVDAHVVKGSPISELVNMIHSLIGSPQSPQFGAPVSQALLESASAGKRNGAFPRGN
jgi:CheY-like chemotaxis protein